MGGSEMSGVRERLRPIICNTIKVPRGPSYSAACFEGGDWSLKPLQRNGDQLHAPDLASRIEEALLGLEAGFAFAPSPVEFNGKIIRPPVLMKESIPLGQVVMYRNPEAPADGTFLRNKGNAGIFSAAGCSMIVATLGQEMVFAHAGRDCVIDRTRMLTFDKERGRHNESVVNNIVSALAPSDPLRKNMHVAVYYSIRPEHFRHDSASAKTAEHLVYNEAVKEMLPKEYGEECGVVDEHGIGIDVPRIIRAQFLSLGVPATNINLDHAYIEDELPTTRNGDNSRRYLAAIVRHS